MSSREGKLILYVSVDENGKKLLLYVRKHIKRITGAGMRVEIVKLNPKSLSAEQVKQFERAKITRFPAMVDPNGVSHVGVAKITGVLEANFNGGGAEIGGGGVARGEIIGSNSDLSDYYSRLLYDEKKGKRRPKKDDSDDEDRDRNDIEDRMREYSRNVPKHRRGDEGRGRRKAPEPDSDEDSDEEAPRSRRGGRRRNDSPPPTRRGGGTDKEMDDMMMRAFLDNQPSDA